VLPIALRYEHGKTERPCAWVSIGAPLAPAAAHAPAVEAELDAIEAAIRDSDREDFETLITTRRRWLDALAEAALASFARRLTG
jgi:hypothetical protein